MSPPASEGGWRRPRRLAKIVVGDRDWRIIFTAHATHTVARAWVIGDRADAECYEEVRRTAELGKDQTAASSRAAVMLNLARTLRDQRQKKRSSSWHNGRCAFWSAL